MRLCCKLLSCVVLNLLIGSFPILSLGAPGLASLPPSGLEPQQEALLMEVRDKAIGIVKKQKSEAAQLRACFARSPSCDPQLARKLSRIRVSIAQKSEEYRILVGLANGRRLNQSNRQTSAQLNMNLPLVQYGTRYEASSTEVLLIQQIYQEDTRAVSQEVNQDHKGYSRTSNFDLVETVLNKELRRVQEFYGMQAFMIIHQVPFVMYLDSAKPGDGDIVKALDQYTKQVEVSLAELSDLEKHPLESFLLYEPIVTSVTKADPAKAAVAEELRQSQRHKVGLKAWIERNKPSVTLAALTGCSLVSAIVQAWPVSLACGGAFVGLSGRQLYVDYHVMKENFVMLMMGLKTYEEFKTSEARLMYSAMVFFMAGQGVGSLVMSIETGLIGALNSLPATAAARFTSLSALREGSLRFLAGAVEFRGRDLGASLAAGIYVDESELPQVPVSNRIFTYRDLLRLRAR